MRIYATAERLRPKSRAYPAHHHGPNVEEAFTLYAHEHAPKIDTNWIYLPIHWQTIYFENRVRNKAADFTFDPEAQLVLDNLDPKETYFTVSQADHVTYERRPANLKVFGCGGGDYAIPLATSPLEGDLVAPPRELLASFVGNIEAGGPVEGIHDRSSWHPDGAGARIRRAMEKAVRYEPGFLVKHQQEDHDPRRIEEFRMTLRRSVFALAPRGYGRQSFRMYEAMSVGAIPVYIYDDAWLPYEEDLGGVGIDTANAGLWYMAVHESELAGIASILRGVRPEAVNSMRKNIAALYDDWFTPHGVAKQIARMVVGAGKSAEEA